jgi:hypothetical protein
VVVEADVCLLISWLLGCDHHELSAAIPSCFWIDGLMIHGKRGTPERFSAVKRNHKSHLFSVFFIFPQKKNAFIFFVYFAVIYFIFFFLISTSFVVVVS